jgi:hypothetical protein
MRQEQSLTLQRTILLSGCFHAVCKKEGQEFEGQIHPINTPQTGFAYQEMGLKLCFLCSERALEIKRFSFKVYRGNLLFK